MVISVVLIFVIRLFQIQIVDIRYRNSADNNALYYRTVYPMRGVIYDRNGKMVVSNQPSYDVTVVMRNVKNLDTLALCRSLDITREFFESRMADIRNLRKNPGYSPYTNQVFMSQLSVSEVADFRENLYRFDGFDINSRSLRKYSYDAAAHLLGDLGEVSRSDIENDSYYTQGDFIGIQGVEKYYETLMNTKSSENDELLVSLTVEFSTIGDSTMLLELDDSGTISKSSEHEVHVIAPMIITEFKNFFIS